MRLEPRPQATDPDEAAMLSRNPDRHRRQVEEAHREALLRGWEVERVEAVAGICIGGENSHGHDGP